MRIKAIVCRILALLGTLLVWFPVLAPLLGVLEYVSRPPTYEGPFNFDYLIPAELFPMALLGGVLLILAELLAGQKGRLHRRLIFWGIGTALAMLAGGQFVATVSGLASGATRPPSIWWYVVLGTLAFYVLGLVVMGTGGMLLLRDLFIPARSRAGI